MTYTPLTLSSFVDKEPVVNDFFTILVLEDNMTVAIEQAAFHGDHNYVTSNNPILI